MWASGGSIRSCRGQGSASRARTCISLPKVSSEQLLVFGALKELKAFQITFWYGQVLVSRELEFDYYYPQIT